MNQFRYFIPEEYQLSVVLIKFQYFFSQANSMCSDMHINLFFEALVQNITIISECHCDQYLITITSTSATLN